MSVELTFKRAPLTSSPVELTFGRDEYEAIPNNVTIAKALSPLTLVAAVSSTAPDFIAFTGTLPALTLAAAVTALPPDYVAVAATLPPLTLAATASFSSNSDVVLSYTFPPLVLTATAYYDVNVGGRTQSQAESDWQEADHGEQGPKLPWQDTDRIKASAKSPWNAADTLEGGVLSFIGDLDHLRVRNSSRWQDADPANFGVLRGNWVDYDRLRHSRSSRFQDGDPIGNQRNSRWQDMDHTSRTQAKSRFQKADHLEVGPNGRWQIARPYEWGRQSRWQEAWPPPAGTSVIVVPPPPPPPDLCYTPPASPIAMVFDAPWLDSDHDVLLFVCENHPVGGGTVVVPVRTVYMITNTATLTRIEGSIPLPVLGMSLQIDMDSWAWGFSATVAGAALDDLQPNSSGDPIELLATINGISYRVIAEKLSRVRTFGRTNISITGRGRSALLDDPYVPVVTFGSDVDVLAQQLANNVLSVAGTPIGWAVDWQLTDWLVSGGAWTKQGTFIDGLKDIAAAAGGYLQPHRTDKQISFLAKYPTAPWDWSTVTPDFVLPSSVTQQESIEWLDKALYNRVYVSGQGAGVLARVTRYGTAGDLLAPMVTDALITANEAAQQRGLAILGDTGRQASVSLKLPVLDATGIITPGKFVNYTDTSGNRLGLVRSVSVDIGRPDIWQTIDVETHE